MNSTLANLSNSFLNNGTGDIVVYYDFSLDNTGVVGAGSNFTGVILNSSPSAHSNYYSGLVLRATGSTSAQAGSNLESFIFENYSGLDLTQTNVKIGSFAENSFLRESDFESESVFLFSFEKVNNTNGVLFGSLVKDSFDNSEISFNFGRGFNVGINDRNKLFFQGIDSTIGEYVLTADQLELARKNICSVRVSPYEVSFSLYNLIDDEFEQQNLRTDSKIQNNTISEPFYLGGSPTYIRGGQTFSGVIDKLLVLSGSYGSTDLKSIASGFVATGTPSSGSVFQDEVITGHQIDLVFPVGITGFTTQITGYTKVKTETELIEFTLQSQETAFPINEGIRFLTGYSLPNNSGDYLEGTSFLIKDNLYEPTGNDAFATLGLKASGSIVEEYTVSSTRLVSTENSLPLYGIVPITGIIQEATGFNKTYLSTTIDRTGSIVGNLQFLDGISERYKFDYLYFNAERI